jgi:transcriptional regulator with XRE-family HTH domain
MYKPITQLPVEQALRIKSLLVLSGKTQKSIASEAGVSPATVTFNILGRSRTPAVRDIICRITGETEESLWGDVAPENEKKRAAG